MNVVFWRKKGFPQIRIARGSDLSASAKPAVGSLGVPYKIDMIPTFQPQHSTSKDEINQN